MDVEVHAWNLCCEAILTDVALSSRLAALTADCTAAAATPAGTLVPGRLLDHALHLQPAQAAPSTSPTGRRTALGELIRVHRPRRRAAPPLSSLAPERLRQRRVGAGREPVPSARRAPQLGKMLQQIRRLEQRRGAVADQPVGAGRDRAGDGPGTAMTSRPWSSAVPAVISAPEPTAASTTTVTRARPLMSRFRRGKLPAWGRSPGGNSVSSSPSAATRSYSARLAAG